MPEHTTREIVVAEETLSELPPKPWYWSRTIWLGVFDKAVNFITIITAAILAFSQNDFVQQNPDLVLWIGIVVGLLNVIKSFAADMLRWIGGLPLTKIVSVLFAMSLLTLPGLASAEEVAVLVNDSNPGTYLLTVNIDKSVTVNPIRVVRPGNNPAPPPPTNPPAGPTPFELEIETQAKAAIALGGSLTTGAAFSEVYAIVSDGVLKGTIDHTRCLEAVNLGTAAILSRSADGAKWSTFELTTRNALQTLDARGNFKTKEDYAAPRATRTLVRR
jgi:hypothetical protein